MRHIGLPCLAGLLLSTGVSAQTQWQHELLLMGSDFYLGVGNPPPGHAVNPDGIPIYKIIHDYDGPQSYRYKTNLSRQYLGPNSQGQSVAINRAGQASYLALDAEKERSLHVMVDGRDFFRELFPPTPPSSAFALASRFLTDDGRPLWLRRDSGQPDRVFLGTDELSRGRAVTSVTLQAMNEAGVAAWHGWLADDQGVRYKELFVGDANYSAPILGANRRVLGGVRLDAAGNVLWSGYGEATGGVGSLYLNDENLTLSQYPRIRGAHAEALQEDGTFWWYMFDESPSVTRLMRNYEDYSTPVFGDEPYGVIQTDTFVSASGDVLWQGSGAVRGLVTFRNHEDLSTALLGRMNSMDDQIGVGIDRFGNAVWWGSGELTNHRAHVFVNGFDLSGDLLGSDHYAVGMAVGENGHVLWVASEGDMRWIYLSTPIPEPGGIVVVAFGLLFMSLRLRKGGRAP